MVGTRWLFYVLMPLFMIVVIVGTIGMLRLDYRNNLRSMERLTENAAGLYAIQAERNVRELLFAVDWMHRRIDPNAPDYGMDALKTETARLIPERLPGVSAIVFINRDGRIAYSTTGVAPIGASVVEREYFKAALSGPAEYHVGTSVQAKGTQNIVYTVSRRLKIDGEFSGLVISSARANAWNEVVAPMLPSAGSLIRLMHEDGRVIVAQRTRQDASGLETLPAERIDIPGGEPSDFLRAEESLTVAGLRVVVDVPRAAAMALSAPQRTRIAVGGSVGVAILVLLSVLGHRTLRREAESAETAILRTAQLEARTKELDQALKMETLLMGELEHRVKNSLTLAASLINLQTRRAPNEQTRAVLRDVNARIMAIARVHDRLKESGSPNLVALDEYLHRLCDDLASNAHIEHRIAADTILMSSSRAVQFGLIVTELLLNAGKYADPGSRIRVDIVLAAAEKTIELTVRDHGRGLPEGFDLKDSPGFGIHMISSLATSLRASLHAENAHPGARFIVRAPLDGKTDVVPGDGVGAVAGDATGNGVLDGDADEEDASRLPPVNPDEDQAAASGSAA